MKTKFFGVLLLAVAIGYSCQNEFVGTESAGNSVESRAVASELNITAAKQYYEANCHSLALPNFDKPHSHSCTDETCTAHHNHEHDSAPPSKMPELKKSNIVLDWAKARTWSDERASYVEVPMNVGGKLYALKRNNKGNTVTGHERTKVECMLVLRKGNDSEQISSMVATLVGHKSYLKDNRKKVSGMNHRVTGSNFSGYVFYSSTTSGTINRAYRYEDGVKVSALRRTGTTTVLSRSVTENTTTTESNTVTISLFDMGINAGTYSLNWEYCDSCGGYHYDWEECDEEEEECYDCGKIMSECICSYKCIMCDQFICICCPNCHIPEPCDCYCLDCGKKECECNICYNCGYEVSSCNCCSVCGIPTMRCPGCNGCYEHCECCKECHADPCECNLCRTCWKDPCEC